MRTDRKIDEAVQRLCLVAPLARPARVVRARLRDSYGDCSKDRRGFLIRVDSRLAGDLAVDSLLHEWAHAVVWEDEDADHGPRWGVAYARIYSDFFG